MPVITINNHQLIYTIAGHKNLPLLLMIHGWGSYRGVWQQTMTQFKDRYYCVAVDLLGFGDSDKPKDADYSIQAQGQRLLQLADELGFDTFNLIGHSMGGQVALSMAAMLAPERVDKLVNVAGVITARLRPHARMIYWTTPLGATFPQMYHLTGGLCSRFRWYAKFVFRAWFYNVESVAWEHWEKDRHMALQPESHISLYRAGQAIHHLNLTDYLPQITALTLTIFGRQDGTVYGSDGRLIEQYVPDSRLVLLDRCGHFPMYEQPAQFINALQTFLS